MTKLFRSSVFNPGLILTLLILCGLVWGEDPPLQQEQVSSIVSARLKTLKIESEAIAREKAEHEINRSQLSSRAAELASRSLDAADVEQAELAADARKVALQSIELDILSAEQNRRELAKDIQKLTDDLQLLAAETGPEARQKTSRSKAALAEKRSLQEIETQHIEQLKLRSQLNKERLDHAIQWQTALREAYRGQQEKARQQRLEGEEGQLAVERQKWLDKAAALREQISQLKDDPYITQAQRDLKEVQLLEAEELLFNVNIREKLVLARGQLERVATVSADQLTEPHLRKETSSELARLESQSASLIELLNSKRALIQQRMEGIQKRRKLDSGNQNLYAEIYSILGRLIASVVRQSSDLSEFNQKVEERQTRMESAYLTQKKRGLTRRHLFPGSAEEWRPLLAELKTLPATLLQTGRNIFLALQTAIEQAVPGDWVLLASLGIAWSLFCLRLGSLATSGRFKINRGFTEKSLHVLFALFHENRFALLFSGLLILAGWVFDIIPPGLAVIGILAGIWLTARLIAGLSWWILKSPAGLNDPELYQLIILWVILASFFSLALALGHLGFLSTSLQELVERLFMLLLLPPVYLTYQIRTLLMEMLKERKGGVYWVRLIGFTGLLIPLAILSAALLGISGYINLAWKVATSLLSFIAVVAAWLATSGVVIDLVRTIMDYISRRSDRSTFWMRSLIEPLQYLALLSLLLISLWAIYRLFISDPASGLDLRSWLRHPLFTLGGASINILDLLGTLVTLLLIFYVGRWAREITSGWLYKGIRDQGVRNSLSVFTQYAVVVVGLLIALNILGINLTSLAVFAGALGVGIGLGLQNIANNFISGLILLAERPVRAKDWVTIGNNEGEVSEIGMRSVTVRTWDNQDVIIPNSDLVSNAFVNWTHTDNMVRTVLIIGVRYQDDPHKAKAVIKEAVTMQPEVSLDPLPDVWLTEFGASSVDFRVHYYVDVAGFNRLHVKSKVMFAIWDALKEAGIGIPFPQQDIYIKELPVNDSRLIE